MLINRKVLVVDDSPTFRTYVSSMLQEAGFEPIVFSNLSETLAFINTRPSLLCSVLDYCLPDAPRGEVIDEVLKAGYRAVVLTGNADKEVRNSLIQKGIVDYILKDSAVSLAFLAPLLNRLYHNADKVALIVDDSPSIIQYLTDLLERQYLTVHSATNGIEALEQFEQLWQVNLVITDNDMPEMKGVELTQRLRAKHTRELLPIIGLSASENFDLVSQFLKAGANDYLNKPFNQEELYCRIHALLDMQDTSEQLHFLTHRDELTGLWNRRYFFKFSNEHPIDEKSIGMIDIDEFKKINEDLGNMGGDHVLKIIGRMVNTAFSTALPARFGGEEFVVLCTGDKAAFHQELEAFRRDVENTPFIYDGKEISVTVSIGLAAGTCNVEALIQEANQKLYDAKQAGRNSLVA